jgi:hypothetical protein
MIRGASASPSTCQRNDPIDANIDVFMENADRIGSSYGYCADGA